MLFLEKRLGVSRKFEDSRTCIYGFTFNPKRKVLYDIDSKDINISFGYSSGLQLQRGKRIVSTSQINTNQLCNILFEICIIPN